jgi:DNA-binding CsgD family transcriptional regulator
MPAVRLSQQHVFASPATDVWELFRRSRVPMSLLDRERRYVAVNDATLMLYRCRREDLLGALAGRTVVNTAASSLDAAWEQVVRKGEHYGQYVVAEPGGSLLQVSLAARATSIGGRWYALLATVSARCQHDDRELIGTQRLVSPSRGLKLTDREREIVQLLARGATTSQIASELVLAEETVRAHVRKARTRNHARTRAQLVALALASGAVER